MFFDAEHAGDTGTHKSRSTWRSHLIQHGSAVQSTTALSSGESECNVLVRSSAHALGTKAMLNDCHYGLPCESRMRLRQLLGKD